MASAIGLTDLTKQFDERTSLNGDDLAVENLVSAGETADAATPATVAIPVGVSR
ncbi:hypothetical protein [Halapricum hydrolyticum]|uniref:Uncharacterized protein n=1 Tax=Halapricum hydrolyticum TaxID=2979991 RepID=A0AAE3IEC8_9EURY|nr:hypothetical protein [Halapricum hydrolyticum]MCU4718731.1 hypothetical protein [Halapricum hydrolyticum]MCU4727718.1 hypothetical protein [Halapricum hydrolyticum]